MEDQVMAYQPDVFHDGSPTVKVDQCPTDCSWLLEFPDTTVIASPRAKCKLTNIHTRLKPREIPPGVSLSEPIENCPQEITFRTKQKTHEKILVEIRLGLEEQLIYCTGWLLR